MSKYIHIAIECSAGGLSTMYALDSDGTVWKRFLDNHDRPFEAFAFSPKEPKPANTKKEKGEPETFEAWIGGLRMNHAYDHINFEQEFGKMKEWLRLNPRRKLTKRFVLNWLNKIEVPIDVNNGQTNYFKCPNRVRKEGKAFLQPCGRPAEALFGEKYYCLECHSELVKRGIGG